MQSSTIHLVGTGTTSSRTENRVDIVGYRFPGGTYRIDAEQHREVCGLLGTTEPEGGVAHGVYGYIATRVGCGLGVDEILALAGAAKEDGPMVGSVDLEFERPLHVGERFDVAGEVTAFERKHGRRLGSFDLLEFRLRLVGEAGDVAAVCTQSWVLPRRES